MCKAHAGNQVDLQIEKDNFVGLCLRSIISRSYCVQSIQ